MQSAKYKGYLDSIQCSDPDGCWYGRLLGIEGLYADYDGITLEELEDDFKVTVDDYIEFYRTDNRKPKVPTKQQLKVDLETFEILPTDKQRFVDAFEKKRL